MILQHIEVNCPPWAKGRLLKETRVKQKPSLLWAKSRSLKETRARQTALGIIKKT